jgi:cell division protein FtsZ
MMKFDLPKEQSSIIKVIGVGGGGSNAVNHMFRQGIQGVDFVVCNTDIQSLNISPVPIKITLGQSLTDGRGAGSIPEVGKNAAIETLEEITSILETNTKMVFVTAGMGGGTGTGAAPIIAKAAKEMGILTVGIVTVPFSFEGKRRKEQAELGIERMREEVDTLLIINNDKLRDMYGNLTLTNAFEKADDVLAIAAKGIAEVIEITGQINVDFNDVSTVMKDSGVAIMGSAEAEGEDRAIKCVENALLSPLLNSNNIKGATHVLLNITYGSKGITMDEMSEITDYIQNEAGSSADVIWGHAIDESLDDNMSVTIIATGFSHSLDTGLPLKEPKKIIRNIDDDVPVQITSPVATPIKSVETTNTNNEEIDEPEKIRHVLELEDTDDIENNDSQEIEFSYNDNQQEISPEIGEDGIHRYTLCDEEEVDEFLNNEEDSKSEVITDSKIEISDKHTVEDNSELAKQRFERIKQESLKLKSPTGLSDLENEPAYKRRNIKLDDAPHSSDSSMSRFSLWGKKGKTGLSDNNSFLHDNVD